MTGPCIRCRFWHHRDKIHKGWGHCFKAQEMTDEEYSRSRKSPDTNVAKMVAIGDDHTNAGIFATFKVFECNEFKPKEGR